MTVSEEGTTEKMGDTGTRRHGDTGRQQRQFVHLPFRRFPVSPLRSVFSAWARFSLRERRFLGVAGIVLSSLALYFLLIDPLWESYTRLHARIAAKERELEDMYSLRRTYLTLRAEPASGHAIADPKFSPIAFLEGLATSTLGRAKVAAINPTSRDNSTGATQETIELQLSGVSLRELVELLYKIDSAGRGLHTTRLSIKKRYKDPYTFDVALTTLAVLPR